MRQEEAGSRGNYEYISTTSNLFLAYSLSLKAFAEIVSMPYRAFAVREHGLAGDVNINPHSFEDRGASSSLLSSKWRRMVTRQKSCTSDSMLLPVRKR